MGDGESKLKAGILINFLLNLTGSEILILIKRISPLQPAEDFGENVFSHIYSILLSVV